MEPVDRHDTDSSLDASLGALSERPTRAPLRTHKAQDIECTHQLAPIRRFGQGDFATLAQGLLKSQLGHIHDQQHFAQVENMPERVQGKPASTGTRAVEMGHAMGEFDTVGELCQPARNIIFFELASSPECLAQLRTQLRRSIEMVCQLEEFVFLRTLRKPDDQSENDTGARDDEQECVWRDRVLCALSDPGLYATETVEYEQTSRQQHDRRTDHCQSIDQQLQRHDRKKSLRTQYPILARAESNARRQADLPPRQPEHLSRSKCDLLPEKRLLGAGIDKPSNRTGLVGLQLLKTLTRISSFWDLLFKIFF